MSLSKAETAKQEVKTLLKSSPRLYGLARSRWRLQDIAQQVDWLQDKSLAGVHKILDRLGFSWQQTISFVRSPDLAFQRKLAWLEAVKRQVKLAPEQYVLLYQDEVSYYQQPRGTRQYWPSGDSSPKHYYAAGQEDTLSRVGAVMDSMTGQVLYRQGDKFGVAAMVELYQTIRHNYPHQQVFVAQDNCPFHKHATVLDTVRNLEIIPVFFPTYASWMNPIEKLWRWLRADVLAGHDLGHSLTALRQAVADFLNTFSSGSPALLRYVGLLPD